jgi:hypothetical protein
VLQVAAALQALPGGLQAARDAGLAEREGKHYLVSLDLKKKTLKAARA